MSLGEDANLGPLAGAGDVLLATNNDVLQDFYRPSVLTGMTMVSRYTWHVACIPADRQIWLMVTSERALRRQANLGQRAQMAHPLAPSRTALAGGANAMRPTTRCRLAQN